MKRLIVVLVIAAIVALAIVLRINSIKAEKEEVPEGVEAIQERDGFPVELTDVKTGEFQVWREVNGRLKGAKEAHIRTPDPARIKEIKYQIGDIVPADTPIILLDKDDPKNMTRVNLLRRLYLEAKSDYEKYRRLNAKGAVPDEAVDKARIQLEAAETDYESALTTVELESPISGVLISLQAREGERANPDKDLAVVSSLDRVRLVTQISETDAQEIVEGAKARIVTLKGDVFEGEVDRISIGADQKTALFDLEILADNKEGKLKIGTYTTASVKVLDTEGPHVDSNALVRDPDGTDHLFQVEDGNAKKVEVKVIARNDRYSLLEEGSVDPSLPLVIVGQSRLKDGIKVRVISEDAD